MALSGTTGTADPRKVCPKPHSKIYILKSHFILFKYLCSFIIFSYQDDFTSRRLLGIWDIFPAVQAEANNFPPPWKEQNRIEYEGSTYILQRNGIPQRRNVSLTHTQAREKKKDKISVVVARLIFRDYWLGWDATR